MKNNSNNNDNIITNIIACQQFDSIERMMNKVLLCCADQQVA